MNLRIFLDRHHVRQSLDPTLDISPYFVKKSILPPIFLSRLFLKRCNLSYPPGCYLPGYPPDYLMLPNLTKQFIKLSDGDLQWE